MNEFAAEKVRRIVEYQKRRLASDDDTTVKRGLQDLCEVFRNGGIRYLDSKQRSQIELELLGLLHKKCTASKIVMWAINALSFVGVEESCAKAIMSCVERHENEVAVVASCIAALQKICSAPDSTPYTNNVSEQVVVLASLRHRSPKDIDVASARIDIEKASPDMLQLALVLVGTEKAPPNLFDPKYSNSEIVRALGSHDHPIVKQYSCWAVVENSTLGYSNLGIPFDTIQDQPPNVRAWMYEALCESGPRDRQTTDYIEEGTRDVDLRAQAGLSHGLRQVYVDGLEPIILDWHAATSDPEIRQNLQYHIASFADQATNYGNVALDAFLNAAGSSEDRINLLSAATGSILYKKMKRLEIQGDPGLFTFNEMIGGPATMTQNFNFNGTAQIGAFSANGNAENHGNLTIESTDELQSALNTLLGELSNSKLSQEQKAQISSLAQQAAAAPNETTIGAIKKAISAIDREVKIGVASGEAWAKILLAVSTFSSFIG